VAEALDQTGAVVTVRMRRGDAWPAEPIDIILALDDTGDTVVPGTIERARLTVRRKPAAVEALAFLDSDLDAALVVSVDQSTVTIAAAALGTDVTSLFPVTDLSVPASQLEACAWDVQLTIAATDQPETVVSGPWIVLPDVTRP
jgi:hypothetical protein